MGSGYDFVCPKCKKEMTRENMDDLIEIELECPKCGTKNTSENEILWD